MMYTSPINTDNFDILLELNKISEREIASIFFALKSKTDETTLNKQITDLLSRTICILNNPKQHEEIIIVIKLLFSLFYITQYALLNNIIKHNVDMLFELLKFFQDNITSSNKYNIIEMLISLMFDSVIWVNSIVYHHRTNKSNILSNTNCIISRAHIRNVLKDIFCCKTHEIRTQSFDYVRKKYFLYKEKSDSKGKAVKVIESPFVIEFLLEIFISENKESFKIEIVKVLSIIEQYLIDK